MRPLQRCPVCQEMPSINHFPDSITIKCCKAELNTRQGANAAIDGWNDYVEAHKKTASSDDNAARLTQDNK